MQLNRETIFPLAIGTFGLGAARIEAGETAEFDMDLTHLKALRAAHEAGYNYIETSYIYAGGQTMRFIGQFLREVPRDSLFITVKVEKLVTEAADVTEQLNRYLKVLGTDYADAVLLHNPGASKLPLTETYAALQRYVESGKSRYISASNLGIEDLRMLVEGSGIKPFSLEGLYNLECKVSEDVGLLDYCRQHGIIFAGYQPLRRGRTARHNFPLLVELSQKYCATQHQIILNWLVREKHIMPLVKMSREEHVAENLQALDLVMEAADYERLNAFRSAEFDVIKVDWSDSGRGVPIYTVANQLD
jgi:diketogulonate reductase-like aldo/keto reductase